MGYYFELPPFTDTGAGIGLTKEQRAALGEDEAIALSGGPGTGKTVVSLWRHIRNHELNSRKSLLLTYTKTLEYYLRLTATTKSRSAGDTIARTYCWINGCRDNRVPRQHFDEIIIDEAQDVEIEQYEMIKRYSDIISYGADEAQSLYCPKCSSMQELKNLFTENEEYELSQNFRNSKEILLFTKSVFPDISIPFDVIENAEFKGRKPFLQVLGWDDFEETVKKNIIDIANDFSEETHNIGILVPSEKQVNKYYDLLSDEISCSKYHSHMPGFDNLDRIHITTFKSAKGLEFDTVIIPGFDSYDWFIGNTENFSENDYYVALTRAKINLFLLCKKDININSTDTYEKG